MYFKAHIAVLADGSGGGAAAPLTPADMGITKLYAAQARALVRALAASPSTAGTEVATVDGFQGREKALILFSTVRSGAAARVGFEADARPANMALTRVQCGVVVVGDAQTLQGCSLWADRLGWVGVWGRVVKGDVLGGVLDGVGDGPHGRDAAERVSDVVESTRRGGAADESDGPRLRGDDACDD